MRTFGTFLGVGILAMTVGCGGSSSSSLDGGGATQGPSGDAGGALGGTGGVMGGNGGAGGGGGGSAGSCNYPSCLASLATSCQPSGTCVEQTDTTTFAINTCYSNGVKVITAVDLTSGSGTVTFKNGSTVCYTFAAGASATGAETLTIKNAAGTTIATGTTDTAGNTTITCTGGSPVTLNSSCQDATGTASSTASCTTGTCTP